MRVASGGCERIPTEASYWKLQEAPFHNSLQKVRGWVGKLIDTLWFEMVLLLWNEKVKEDESLSLERAY